MQSKAEEIVDDFSTLDSWEERYEYLMELGDEIPPMPESEKSDENRVHGCQSLAWVTDDGTTQTYFSFRADSDSAIVRGLIALLQAALNGCTPKEVCDFDVDSYFSKLDLYRHISARRGNGVREMVKRLQRIAVENA